ncbi:hypothetical protein J416_02129 [Gracilibacillus halophilus YIM-C55.5]|uniref:Uncharacterized protein n=1 Tax=Gracilibacillus halophilus YIM-C55.5 TaxID=1308866 RepID=N4WFT9_9BACI|nr:hypothetical protein [Gracilibacillus halophilus]ENH98124.1 hypothetical protein J416_02129 [Gracilibacillus halophilus YIM-C55.5]
MFNIKTFIKRPSMQIDNLNEVIENPNRYFINIDDEIEIKKYNQYLDFDYINGAITIEYYNNLIMDFSLWDLVDQLWSYLIQLVEDVVQTGYGMTYFPDQPVKIEMKVVSKDLLLFALDEGEIIRELLPMQEFINALFKSAENFYSSFIAYFEREIDFSYELNKIKTIQEQIN